MRLLGLTVARTKALEAYTQQQVEIRTKTVLGLTAIDATRGWWPFGGFHEVTTGGWQRNETVELTTALRHPTVFACVSLIQKDMGKMRLRLMLANPAQDDVLEEVESSAYSPVLRRPNSYQTRQQFIETWINSKLLHGNAIVLKVRDERRVVVALHVIDPTRIQLLVAPDGSIFYELQSDDLSGVGSDPRTGGPVRVPAREIIHDRMPALFHPLIGVSPLYAAGAVAEQGLTIQDSSNSFFGNGARPGGILTIPGNIAQDRADSIKSYWESAFSGTNSGKVALLTNGMEYKAVTPATASDSQLVEQTEWLDEKICSCFGVPPHKVGVGDQPNYSNIEALNQQYWSECLQHFSESMQTLLRDGLSAQPYDIRFDLSDLFKMDTTTKVKAASEGIRAGFLAPNEARRIFFDLPPVEGGDTPYMQHQDYSLAALNRRDSEQPAPSNLTPAASAVPAPAKEVIVVTSQPVPDGQHFADGRRLYQQLLGAAAS